MFGHIPNQEGLALVFADFSERLRNEKDKPAKLGHVLVFWGGSMAWWSR